jgi:methylenetetrahydrofolate reductase (NADPH)
MRRHGNCLRWLMLPRAYRPERLLDHLAPCVIRPESGVAGLHLFTLNELAQTERWRTEAIARLAGRGL